MAMNQMGAGFQLMAHDGATPVFGRVGAGFGRMTNSIRSQSMGLNKTLGTVAAGFAALKIGTGMVGMAKTFSDAAGTFERGLVSVALKARATEAETMQLHDKAIKSAMESQFSPDESIDALENLATKGFNAADQMAILDDVLNMASAGAMNMNDAADAVSGTMRSMGYDVDKSTMVTDKLLKITQMTNFQTRDFAIGLSRATSTAKLYGQSLSDTLINMGLLRNMNIEASVASTSLRESWRRLASDQRAQQQIQKLGIDIFDEQTGKIRPMLDIMSEVSEASKDLTDKERMRMATTAFGVRGMASFNAIAEAQYKVMDGSVPIILQGQKAINAMRLELAHANDEMTDSEKKTLALSLGIDDLDKTLQDATGTAEYFKEQLLDTYEGQKTLIEGARQALAVVVGEAGTKLFKPVARMIYLITSAMANFFNNIPMEARQVLIGIVTAMGVLLGSAGAIMLLSGAFSLLGISLTGVIIAFGQMALVMAPIMVLISGLAVGVYAAYRAFQRNTGGVADSWEEMVRKIKLGWKGIVELIKGEGFSKELRKELDKAENQGVLRFLDRAAAAMKVMRSFWDGVVAGFNKGVDAMAASPAMARLKETLGGVFGFFTGEPMDTTESAMQRWASLGESTGDRLASFGEIAIDALNKVLQVVKSLTDALGNMTAADINSGINTLADTFDVLWTALNKVSTAVKIIYNFFKGLLLLIGEFFRNLASGIGKIVGPFAQGIGEIFAHLAPKTLREQQGFVGDIARGWFSKGKGLAGAGEWMAGGQLNFEGTIGAFGDLGDAIIDEADRMAGVEDSLRARQARATVRESQASRLGPLMEQRRNLLEWMALPTATWRQTEAGQAGNYSWEEASAEQRAQFTAQLAELNKNIKSLGGKVIVNLDGEKVAEGLRKTPSVSGDDSLEEVPVQEDEW